MGSLVKVELQVLGWTAISVPRETQIVYGRHLTAGVPLSDVSPREHLFSPEGEVSDRILRMKVLAFPGRHLLSLSL